MKKNYKLADSVLMRLVQIFQEALIMNIDGADLMREVRLELDPNDESTLVLTEAYKQKVVEMHAKLVERAAELQRVALTKNSKE